MEPLISVVVPVYNTDRQLPRCIESILNQDFRDYELILVNDGSTDSTPEICDRYAEQFDHITVIHKENGGVADARNVGMRQAGGDYIYFMDSDDWIEINTLKSLDKAVSKTDTGLIIFGYTKKMITDSGVHYVYSHLNKQNLDSSRDIQSELCALLDQGIRYSVWNKLFRRDIIEQHDLSFPSMSRVDDIAFTMDFFRCANNLLVLPERYYFHENYYDPEKYTPEVFSDHVELFHTFYDLFPGWMQDEQNYRFAARLFGFWFFFKIPKIIIGMHPKKIALEKIREIVKNDQIQRHVDEFSQNYHLSPSIHFPIMMLKWGNPVLLYSLNRVLNQFVRLFKKYV